MNGEAKEEEGIETYYLVGTKYKNRMIPVGDVKGKDKIPAPLFTTKDTVREYRNFMQGLYPDEKYYCLKASVIED